MTPPPILLHPFYPHFTCFTRFNAQMLVPLEMRSFVVPFTQLLSAHKRCTGALHLQVNDMLGKPMFDCTRAMERWRTGPADGSCG